MFAKWLLETDALIASTPGPSTSTPTYYERNLTVWRQLWRVCELSSILLILLDVRCPLLHYPPSLRNYVLSLRPPKKVILVLTKCDLVPPSVAKAWKSFLEAQDGDKVVCVESYSERSKGVYEQGTGKQFDPGMGNEQMETVLDAIEEAHRELCEPPEALKQRPERLKTWKPRVRSHVNFAALRGEQGGNSKAREEETVDGESKEDAFLTIGLIGKLLRSCGDSAFAKSAFRATQCRKKLSPQCSDEAQSRSCISHTRQDEALTSKSALYVRALAGMRHG
jgi:hypothetical protein